MFKSGRQTKRRRDEKKAGMIHRAQNLTTNYESRKMLTNFRISRVFVVAKLRLRFVAAR